MIKFSHKKVATTILDPRENFSRKEIKTEIRYDPLTGASCRLAHFGMITLQKVDFSSWDTPENRSRCPFCPPNIEKITPCFPPEILPKGRLYRGETTLFPNISPYDQYSALAVMSHEHVMPLKKLSRRILKDAFCAGLEFLKIVAGKETDLPYHIIIWNYMPPSGGGLVHPHLQIIASEFPGNLFRKLLEQSKHFYLEHEQNYWEKLCSIEKKQDKRFIGERGKGCWLASFAPLGILGEFMGIFPEIHTIFDVDENAIDDLTDGLVHLFKYFRSENIYSFNVGLFFAPSGAQKYFPMQIRIVPRTFLNLSERPPDINALQMVMQEPFAVVHPESQCAKLKSFW